MMKKIELYLQKKIIKNHQKVLGAEKAPKKNSRKFSAPAPVAA